VSRRHLTTICATAVAIVFALMATAPAHAQPQPPTPQARVLAQAINTISLAIGNPNDDRAPLKVGDPNVMAALGTITESIAKLGTPELPISGFATFDAICNRLNQVSAQFRLIGSKALLSVQPPDQAKLEAHFSANILRYRDEFALLIPAVARCQAAHLPALEQFWVQLPADQKTEQRREGLRLMRTGMMQMFQGLFVIGTETHQSDAHRRSAIEAAVDMAPNMVRALPVPRRKELLAQLETAQPKLPVATQPLVQRIQQSLSQTVCEGLCLVE
jgi:hypothetical protein